MISILCPTRKRPEMLKRMVESVRATSSNVEIVLYVDEDDPRSAESAITLRVPFKIGPRLRKITQAWNELLPFAHGEIYQQGNDDCIYRTHGWDKLVEEAFAEVPDRILLVHGNNGAGIESEFAPHPLVNRRWIEALGYFIAPYFSSDFGDTWNWEIACWLGRRRYLPFTCEHIHYAHGKAAKDENTLDRLKRHTEDNVEQLYADLLPQRLEDAAKLRALMQPGVETGHWQLSGGGPVACTRCGSKAIVEVAGREWCNGCANVRDIMERV